MEERFVDLLRDAFAGDLEFESVYSEEDASESKTTKQVETLQQEAASLCQTGTINTAEAGGEEPPGDAGLQTEVVAEERYTSSGEGPGQDGWGWEDRGEEGNWGKQLTPAHSAEEGPGGVRPPEERGPLPPRWDGNTRVRNEEQGESESDEMSYFWRVPEHGSRAERTEDDQEETGEVKSDSESEASRSEKEEEEEEEDDGYDDDEHNDEEEEDDNGLSLCFEQEVKNPHWDSPAEDTLDFPELAEQHLQDFKAADGESAEKMKDFSGEEHQEAGESFAEYPSDFSSCEDTEDGETDEDGNGQRPGFWGCRQRVTDSETPFVVGREPSGTASGEGAEMSSDTSDSSSDDESQTTSDEEPEATLKGLKNKRQAEERPRGSRLCDDLFAADVEGCPGGTLCPAEGGRVSSGSLDDSFFFSKGPQDSPMPEEFEDEYEERNNWEQEQERIRAFNEFYADSDQLTGEEGRQTKVQFCSELLSQVIVYETDSSDGDSLSSSTGGEDEPSSADTPEEPQEPDERAEDKPIYDVPRAQAESLSRLSQERKRPYLDMLKVTLKMGAITVTGLLMFWWATDQAGWLSQVSFL